MTTTTLESILEPMDTSKFAMFAPPPPPDWLPVAREADVELVLRAPYMVPAPPIPENLHNRRRVLYGFRVPDGVIERYIKEKETHTIPPEFYWRRQYKWALLRSIAHDIDLPFYTRYHEVIEGCGTEPDGDMVYWSTGGYGHVLAPRVPSADKLALFAERLGLEGVEPAWH